MSFNTSPNPGLPQKPEFVGAFEFARPTHTLRALIYSLYILAFVLLADLAWTVGTAALDAAIPPLWGTHGSLGPDLDVRSIALSLGFCLIPILVARGINHGSPDMWRLVLLLALLTFVQLWPVLMHFNILWAYPWGFMKVQALFMLVMPVAVLALLFTPAVRHHCAT